MTASDAHKQSDTGANIKELQEMIDSQFCLQFIFCFCRHSKKYKGRCGYEGWVKAQEDFAKRAKNCLLIKLDCGHNLHYYKSEYIVEKIKEFMKDQ